VRGITRSLVLLLPFLCVGCLKATAEERPDERAEQPPAFSSKETTRRLTLLHSGDNESDLLGVARSDNGAAPRGGIARMASLVRALEARAKEPVLIVGAGDTFMPAAELQVELEGKNAVATANRLLGYKASALGNHEWDLGEHFLAEYLVQASFPYLSATVQAEAGPLLPLVVADGWVEQHPGKLMPRARACAGRLVDEGAAATCDGLTVGLVGATTELLRRISNVPDHVRVSEDAEALRAQVQAEVDALRRDGVDVIVLLSHLQDARNELALVERGLVGVDVIVAGGGDNRFASRGHRLLGDDEPDRLCKTEPDACYPLVRKAADGKPVLVVATDGQLRYVGALSVGFDDEGVLTGFSPGSRPWPVDDSSLVQLRAEPARDAVALEGQVRDALAPLTTPFATAAYFFEGTREEVRNRQTNLGDLSADAMAFATRKAAPDVAFALRNGGGIRAPMGRLDEKTYARSGGPLRPIDLQGALRFDGSIVVVRATHAVLREALESSLRGAGTGRGHFPQVSRELYLEYNKAASEQTHEVKDGAATGVSCPGARVRTLRYTSANGEEVPVVEDGRLLTPDALVVFSTLGYLAKGGDGWFPGRAANLEVSVARYEGGDVREQRSLLEYVEELQRRGEWSEGRGYPDPVRGRPETFTRIREVEGSVGPDGACRS
jgi:2',3'-cyclic-nucleotide 2'-phosphodiesterase (5'-nucleotidase family)